MLKYQRALDKKLRPSPKDLRDHISAITVPTDLPASVDLKPDVVEVEDQLQYNSCTANAGCSALELMYNIKGRVYDLSRFFLYYYVRKLGNIAGDEGAYPRDIARALRNYGVCREETWLYESYNLNVEPSTEAQTEAVPFKIISYEQLFGNRILQMKSAVAQGIPVLLTMQVHYEFYYLSGDWKTHDWDSKTTTVNTLDGYHEVLVIGYDDETQRFLVQNSWGPDWGDGGFFGIPYNKINTEAIGELWIVNPNYSLETLPVPEPIEKEKIPTIWKLVGLAITIVVASWFILG